jgi:hypothetical protein
VVDLHPDEKLPVPLDDFELVRLMLRYLYGLEYLDSPDKKTAKSKAKSKESKKDKKQSTKSDRLSGDDGHSQPSRGVAVTHAQMCVMADFYGIPNLATFARHKLDSVAKELWDTQDFVDTLKLLCCPPLEGHMELQELVITTITKHPSLLEKPEIEAILKPRSSLMYALLKKFHSKETQKQTWSGWGLE